MWEYQAKPDLESRYEFGVYDGDTYDLIIDIGFKHYARHRIRLLGINTPELKGKTRQLGLIARDIVRTWMQEALEASSQWPLIIQARKSDSFGRYLATIQRLDTGEDLTSMLLKKGYSPFLLKKK